MPLKGQGQVIDRCDTTKALSEVPDDKNRIAGFSISGGSPLRGLCKSLQTYGRESCFPRGLC